MIGSAKPHFRFAQLTSARAFGYMTWRRLPGSWMEAFVAEAVALRAVTMGRRAFDKAPQLWSH
jgi:hypothetical protein